MDTPDNTGHAVAILGNGQIVAAGEVAGDFAAAIYEPNGERCSGKGSVATDFGADFDGAAAIAIQSDGKIVVAGHAGKDYGSLDFALARYQGGDCPPKIWFGHYIMVHIFIHPQDLVGPPAPILRKELYKQLQVGRSEQLAIPASDGSAFAGPARSGYQAFELTEAVSADQRRGSLVAVTTALGSSFMELLEAHRLLVPTDIADARAGGQPSSAYRSPVLKCYRVKMNDAAVADPERKRVTVTDALNRPWSLEVGEPESLCKPIDAHGREQTSAATGLLSYRVRDLGGSTSPQSARLAVANEFGLRTLQSDQPASILLPAVVE